MKLTLIVLVLMIFVGQVAADGKKEYQVIAKSIQCSYLREKSFADLFEVYSVEKQNSDYIKKVSDTIYSQAFKICDPDNITNAEKDILNVCTTSCSQLVTKGLLGLGGPSSKDIENCKKMCLNYSDLLSANYAASTKALEKFADSSLPAPQIVKPIEATVVPQVSPALPTSDTTLENKDEAKE